MMQPTRYSLAFLLVSIPAALAAGCGDSDDPMDPEPMIHDPATAEHVAVDRFSDTAGHLFVRTADNGLPEANQAVDFDQGPFITHGLGPAGESIRYYNFDVQPLAPAPIYVLFHEGEDAPVAGQLNIIGVIPGDAGYNDFWQVSKVTVPADYVANTAASITEISQAGYAIEATDILVNCPVVPEGSTARLRAGSESSAITQGWYNGKVVHYFSFEEAPLAAVGGAVPVSPIYVTFNVNPDMADPASGPPSGFVVEDGTDQTHNVTASLPGDESYSPLWMVNVYDNQDFAAVSDLATVEDPETTTILASGVANVNCPIVEITVE